jgi:hypothetical protein
VHMRHRRLGTLSAVSTLGSSTLNSRHISHIFDTLRKSTLRRWK